MDHRAKPGERLRLAAAREAAIVAKAPIGAAITAVAAMARDPSRRSIRVGGRIVARLDAAAVDELGIGAGSEWTEALAQRVIEQTGFERYRAYAMRCLASRPLSRREMISRLLVRGASESIAERVARELEHGGFLNEEAYAEALVRSVTRSRPAGSRLLASKLRSKGVEREAAAAAVRKAVSESDPEAEALTLATRRARSMGPHIDPRTRARRLFGLLARRGFDPGVAARVVRIALESSRSGIFDADQES